MIAFTVYGVASGMGSKRAFIPKGWRHPVITDTNRNLRSWQALVAAAASQVISTQPDWQILDGAVRLTVAFYLPRPKSLAKKIVAHTKAPDCSKLIRALEDALSAVVFINDSQVTEIVAAKFYAAPTDSPHVHVRVEPTTGTTAVMVPSAPLPLFREG